MKCSACDKLISARPGDAVHHTSAGIFCAGCLRTVARQAPEPKKTDGRKAAAASRWANMTPEARAERIAKMQAGRKKGV